MTTQAALGSPRRVPQTTRLERRNGLNRRRKETDLLRDTNAFWKKITNAPRQVERTRAPRHRAGKTNASRKTEKRKKFTATRNEKSSQLRGTKKGRPSPKHDWARRTPVPTYTNGNGRKTITSGHRQRLTIHCTKPHVNTVIGCHGQTKNTEKNERDNGDVRLSKTSAVFVFRIRSRKSFFEKRRLFVCSPCRNGDDATRECRTGHPV